MLKARVKNGIVLCGYAKSCPGGLGVIMRTTTVKGAQETKRLTLHLYRRFTKNLAGVLYEESSKRRLAEKHGLRSERHVKPRGDSFPLFAVKRDGSFTLVPVRRTGFGVEALPVQVRCPRCRWINEVPAEVLLTSRQAS